MEDKSDAALTAQLIADFQTLSTLFMDSQPRANQALSRIGRALGVETNVDSPISALCERLEKIFEVMEARRQEEEGRKPRVSAHAGNDPAHKRSKNPKSLLRPSPGAVGPASRRLSGVGTMLMLLRLRC